VRTTKLCARTYDPEYILLLTTAGMVPGTTARSGLIIQKEIDTTIHYSFHELQYQIAIARKPPRLLL
jgi:hypothetical protein